MCGIMTAPSSEWSVLGLPVHTWWLRCHYTEHMQGGECPYFQPPSTNLLMLIKKVSAGSLHMKRQLVMCQIHRKITSLLFWMNPLTQKHIRSSISFIRASKYTRNYNTYTLVYSLCWNTLQLALYLKPCHLRMLH